MATSRTGARGRVASVRVSSHVAADGTYTVDAPAAPARSTAARFSCGAHPHVSRDGKPGFSANGMFGPQGHLVLIHKLSAETAAEKRPS